MTATRSMSSSWGSPGHVAQMRGTGRGDWSRIQSHRAPNSTQMAAIGPANPAICGESTKSSPARSHLGTHEDARRQPRDAGHRGTHRHRASETGRGFRATRHPFDADGRNRTSQSGHLRRIDEVQPGKVPPRHPRRCPAPAPGRRPPQEPIGTGPRRLVEDSEPQGTHSPQMAAIGQANPAICGESTKSTPAESHLGTHEDARRQPRDAGHPTNPEHVSVGSRPAVRTRRGPRGAVWTRRA